MGAAGLSLVCASADCRLSATLAAPPHAQAAWRATPVAVTDALSLRLEGSGPFRGNVQGELYLLRAGVVQAFGKHGSMRYWRAVSSTMVALSKDEHAPLSECQLAVLNDCWMLRFLTKEEAATTKEGALPAPPPKYGPDTEVRSRHRSRSGSEARACGGSKRTVVQDCGGSKRMVVQACGGSKRT
eukprot:3918547-Pleurochrysis_carterae.AAC.1